MHARKQEPSGLQILFHMVVETTLSCRWMWGLWCISN